MGNPSFRGRLGLDHPLGLLFSQGHLTAEPKKTLDLALELRAALPQRADLRRPFERRTQRTQIVRGGFRPGNEGFEGHGDIAPARVDGNDRIVLAAATFQETDHWLTPRECARDRSELGPELWQSQITRGVKM